jgi:hypothetical protein
MLYFAAWQKFSDVSEDNSASMIKHGRGDETEVISPSDEEQYILEIAVRGQDECWPTPYIHTISSDMLVNFNQTHGNTFQKIVLFNHCCEKLKCRSPFVPPSLDLKDQVSHPYDTSGKLFKELAEHFHEDSEELYRKPAKILFTLWIWRIRQLV